MGDFPTSHGSGKHYRVAPAEGKWRLTIVLPWWCHEYHWETLSYMAFPRHAEVGTASAILDSLGWTDLADAGTRFLEMGTGTTRLHWISRTYQQNSTPVLWYISTILEIHDLTFGITLYRIGHFTPVAAEKSPVLTAQKIPATARPVRCSMRPGRGAAIPLIPWSQGTVAMGTTRKWPTKNSILSIDLGK